MRTLSVRFLLLLGVACAWAQETTITIDANSRALHPIPRSIYGTFLEPIGNSTYGGLWAEILTNPSFEENLWNAAAIRRMLDQNPSLVRASELGLPLPWEPLESSHGARFEPRYNDAANSYRSLMIMALPDRETGVRQAVYLPVHRTRHYIGSIYIKHVDGPAAVEISLRRRNKRDTIFAKTSINAAKEEWTKYRFTLELKEGQVKTLEAVDFVISLDNGARAMIDLASLLPADHVEGMDPEMVEMSRALKTPIVRFGGNYTSAYHWRDGVGPRDKRISMLNLAWGMPEYNQFGTDEFLRFCKLIGAEPQVALNLGTGTPKEAADWVRYINQHWGHGGLLWELGNELWGDFQTGYPTLARVAELTRRYSDAVRAVDPHARLIATGQDPDHFKEWNAAQLRLGQGKFDYLSTHFVVGSGETKAPGTHDAVALSSFALPVELERRIQAMTQQIEQAGMGQRVHIAFTEWLFYAENDSAPRFYNMGGAICTAGMLNMLIRSADRVPISDMTGLIEFGGIWKKLGRVFGVPAYWAFRMYSTADASHRVSVTSTGETYRVSKGNPRLPEIADVPYLDLAAGVNDSGTQLTLFAVNRDLQHDRSATLDLRGFATSGQATVETLTSHSIYDKNTEENPSAVIPSTKKVELRSGAQYNFPHASVTKIVWTK